MECFGFGVSSWLASHLQWQKRARDYFIVAFFECTSSFTAACAPWARTERSSREMRLFFRTQTISSLLHSSRTFFFFSIFFLLALRLFTTSAIRSKFAQNLGFSTSDLNAKTRVCCTNFQPRYPQRRLFSCSPADSQIKRMHSHRVIIYQTLINDFLPFF